MSNKSPTYSIRNNVWTNKALAPIVLGFVLVFLLGSAAITYQNVLQLHESAQWVAHTREVLATTESMLAETNEAESAERGFVLSGKGLYRQQFEKAVASASNRLQTLTTLTKDNRLHQDRLSELATAMQRKVDIMRKLLDTHDTWRTVTENKQDAEVGQLLETGTEQLQHIRMLVSEIKDDEDRLLDARIGLMNRQLSQTGLTLLASTLVACSLVGGTFFLLRRHWGLQETSQQESARQGREIDELARYNQRLLESTGEGIYGIDREGKCSFMNRAGALMLGGLPDDFMGKNMHELVHHTKGDGTSFPLAECPIFKALQTGDGCRTDKELFWTLDGRSFPVDYSSFPVFGDEDKTLHEGAVITFNDISASVRTKDELKLARDAAEAANESKSQFLANMSHELRTPLNAVIMYSELLIEEAEDQDVTDFTPDLQKIGSAGKHLLDLVNSVLDLSKIEAGKMELYPEEFTIADVVNEVATTVEPLMDKNHNTLKIEVCGEPKSVFADITKVRQVLFNLLSNASKFTKNGTVELRVESASQEETVTFTVSDTGIGMTEEQVSRLFQPFSQADASTTRKYGGTGLGLAIIRRFTDLMNGEVGVSSVEGEGTTFTVTIPARAVAPVESSESTPESSATDASESTDGTTRDGAPVVLVIDDDPAIRDVLMRVLVSEGIRPVTAANGAEGLKRARELNPDMIILDVLMPKVDGWSVLATLKADDALSDIPVIMQSIHDDRNLGFMLGACEYLVKPVNRKRLVSILQRHLQSAGDSVLVVEDDDATQRAVARSLKKQGWRVSRANNGVEALHELRREQPAAILLDLVMPEMDGFDFLDEFRTVTEWQSIPVIVLTSKDLTEEDRARLNGGVERIVEKSGLSREQFLNEVRRLVGTVTHAKVDATASPSETHAIDTNGTPE